MNEGKEDGACENYVDNGEREKNTNKKEGREHMTVKEEEDPPAGHK